MNAGARNSTLYLAAAVLLFAAGFVILRSRPPASSSSQGAGSNTEAPPVSKSPDQNSADLANIAREAREKLAEAKIHYQAFLASERAQDPPSRARHYKNACRILDELLQTLQALPADKGEVGPIFGEATQLRADLSKKGYTEDG